MRRRPPKGGGSKQKYITTYQVASVAAIRAGLNNPAVPVKNNVANNFPYIGRTFIIKYNNNLRYWELFSMPYSDIPLSNPDISYFSRK